MNTTYGVTCEVSVDKEMLPKLNLLKRKEVVDLVGLCYTTIYNLEKQGKFPARRKVSKGRVAWVRSEVEEWVRNLPTL